MLKKQLAHPCSPFYTNRLYTNRHKSLGIPTQRSVFSARYGRLQTNPNMRIQH